MGTRFCATKEAPIHDNVKQAYVDNDERGSFLIFRNLKNTARVGRSAVSEEVVRRLSQPDAAEGFLLDGYPRNLAQVMHLDEFLQGRDEKLDAVIALVVPREESLTRLTARAAEQGRADDTEAAIATRLEIYERETAPILDVYGTRGIVDEIDGVGGLDEITARISAALEARGLRPAL